MMLSRLQKIGLARLVTVTSLAMFSFCSVATWNRVSLADKPYHHGHAKHKHKVHTGHSKYKYKYYGGASKLKHHSSYHYKHKNRGGFHVQISPYGLGFSNFHYGGSYSNFYRPSHGYYRPSIPYGSGFYSSPRIYQPYSGYYSSQYSSVLPGTSQLGLSEPLLTDSQPNFTPAESLASSAVLDRQTPRVTTRKESLAKIPTNAAALNLQQRAEQAFFDGRYVIAGELAGQALRLDPQNGQLMLFVSHTNFANGKFTEASNHLDQATAILTPDQWGTVVQQFRTFYGRNDYVSQTNRLNQHILKQPNDAAALALRGYHYANLDYLDAATSDVRQALAIDPENELANRLIRVFDPNTVPAQPGEIQAPIPQQTQSLNQSNVPADGIIRLVPQFTQEELDNAVPVEILPQPSVLIDGPDN